MNLTYFGSCFEMIHDVSDPFSTRSLGHVMFSFAGNAQEAGATENIT